LFCLFFGGRAHISHAIPIRIHKAGTITEKELNLRSILLFISLTANPSGKQTGLHRDVTGLPRTIQHREHYCFSSSPSFQRSFDPAAMDFFILGVSVAFAKGYHSAIIGWLQLLFCAAFCWPKPRGPSILHFQGIFVRNVLPSQFFSNSRKRRDQHQ
jgi:hypothetical protein